MASDGQPVKIPVVSLVHGSQAPTTVRVQSSGKTLPPSGNTAASAAAVRVNTAARTAQHSKPPVPVHTSEPEAQVAFLNKYLNDSGRPAQFRVDPTSGNKVIQEINPANGEVIAEYSATEFAALARSVGISGAIVDDHA
jgi:FlaG protein